MGLHPWGCRRSPLALQGTVQWPVLVAMSSLGEVTLVLFVLWNKDFFSPALLLGIQLSEMQFEKLFSFLKIHKTLPPSFFQSQLPNLGPELQGQFILYLLKAHSESFHAKNASPPNNYSGCNISHLLHFPSALLI